MFMRPLSRLDLHSTFTPLDDLCSHLLAEPDLGIKSHYTIMCLWYHFGSWRRLDTQSSSLQKLPPPTIRGSTATKKKC